MRGVKTTTENIREISLYIIGVAAHQSYDFETSLRLHEDLRFLLRGNAEIRRSLSPISSRLSYWISRSCTALALRAYYNEHNLDKAIELSSKALSFEPNSPQTLLNQAMYVFQAGDIAEAERLIALIKRKNGRMYMVDGAWRYSDAFLLFYKEKFERGLAAYKRAFKEPISRGTYMLLIDFLAKHTKAYPQQLQFHFALAHILMQKDGNCPMALEPLELFFAGGGNLKSKYSVFAGVAREYLLNVYQVLNTPLADQISF